MVIRNKKLGRKLLRTVRDDNFREGTQDYAPKNESEPDSRKPGNQETRKGRLWQVRRWERGAPLRS